MIESELAEVDPPPVGDLVDDAIRDGRALRRTRLVQRGVACVAAVGALVLGLGMASTTLRPDDHPGPGYGVVAQPTPTTTGPAPAERATALPPGTPTMAIYQADPDYSGFESRPASAEPAAVLFALGTVLPTGWTAGQAGGRFDTYTGVQVFLNRGNGFGMVRVAVARYLRKPAPGCGGPPGVVVRCTDEEGALVETFEIESNCVQRRGVNVYRTDGIVVQINVGSCLVDGQWTMPSNEPLDEQVLGVDEAVQIGLAPIWNEKFMVDFEAKASERYPDLPILTAFDGVGA
jgi:hypothetical protein